MSDDLGDEERREQVSKLSSLLRGAVETAPSSELLTDFFTTFLKTEFLVPRRDQETELSGDTQYPSSFTDILGVTSDTETFIPVFTDSDEVEEWFPHSLELHKITGEALCKRLPEGWWITLNPASDFGKEFSPWEVARLVEGSQGIEEVVADQLSSAPKPVNFRAQSEEERTSLAEKLSSELMRLPTLSALYCGIQITEEENTRLFGGVTTDEDREPLRSELDRLLHQALIGDDPYELYLGSSLETDVSLSLFRFSDPLYVNPHSKRSSESGLKYFWNRLRTLFKTPS